jgi:hypothetical protein
MNYSQLAFERSNYQLNNLWEFSVRKNDENNWPLITYVTDASLPFLNLTVETRNTGEKSYNGFTPIESFSLTFKETTQFSTYNYFNDWLKEVFDEANGTFISLPPTVEKGGPGDNIHRSGILSFNTFELSGQKVVDVITKEIQKEVFSPFITYKEVEKAVFKFIRYSEYERPDFDTIVTKEILGNIFTSLGRQVVNTAVGSATNVLNRARGLVGLPTKTVRAAPEPPTRKSTQRLSHPFEYKFRVNRISHSPKYRIGRVNMGRLIRNIRFQLRNLRVSTLREKQTKSFVYENLKILGISEVSLNYGDGTPLQFTVNFTADRIYPLERNII